MQKTEKNKVISDFLVRYGLLLKFIGLAFFLGEVA